MFRRVISQGKLDTPDINTTLLIVNSTCDQCLAAKYFVVLNRTGRYVQMIGAFKEHGVAASLEVVTAAIVAILPDGRWFLLIYHNNQHQVECLLPTHRARAQAHGIRIDKTAKIHLGIDGNPGPQGMHINEQFISFFFDRLNFVLEINEPTQL